MLDHAEKAIAFVGGMDWPQFAGDEKTRFAVVRAVEIVGEAARRVPEDFRDSQPQIPWRRIIGMRNVLAHDYIGTNPRVVYDTVVIFLPELISALRPLIDGIGGDG
ncbi:hypothetical protein WV31_15540 [Magnetospirillum sp. ME-1]|nr:hypothetical protein WV31_15540 [Magnetospirillum sp. ME-1]